MGWKFPEIPRPRPIVHLHYLEHFGASEHNNITKVNTIVIRSAHWTFKFTIIFYLGHLRLLLLLIMMAVTWARSFMGLFIRCGWSSLLCLSLRLLLLYRLWLRLWWRLLLVWRSWNFFSSGAFGWWRYFSICKKNIKKKCFIILNIDHSILNLYHIFRSAIGVEILIEQNVNNLDA